MRTNGTQIKALLLDIDGTLIDSNDAHASAWTEALQEHGATLPFAVLRKCIGMGGDHILPRLLGVTKDSEIGKAVSKRRGEIFRERYLDQIKVIPGTNELLSGAKELGLKLVVATSASKADSSAIFDRFDFSKFVDLVTNSSDADKSKPDPDIILAALKKADLKPGEAIMLGDTPYDVEASVRAGVKAIAFTSGGWSREDLAGAIRVFENSRDFAGRLRCTLDEIDRI